MDRERDITYETALQKARLGMGVYTDRVILPLGSLMTVRLASLHPSVVTIAGLVVGVASSLLAIVAVDVHPAWPIGLLVAVGWQLAYVLDSADGQLARAAGKCSPSGGMFDTLCDFAVQSGIVAAMCAAISHHYDIPAALLAWFAATWMVNLVVSGVLRGVDATPHRLLPARSPAIYLLKLPRDYGFKILSLGLAYAFSRPLLLLLVMGLMALNQLYLVGMMVREAYLSIMATRSTPAAALAEIPEPKTVEV